MRIALAQLNSTVGDIAGNTALVLKAMQKASSGSEGTDILLIPEMMILGYPPRDLLLREGVVEACESAVEKIAVQTAEMTVLIGYPRRAAGGRKPIHNSVAICRNGSIERIYDKQIFPGYDVFDEDRYFEPGSGNCLFELNGKKIGVLICEDIWQAKDVSGGENLSPEIKRDPVEELVQDGCEVLMVASASPFVLGKGERHVTHLADLARKHKITIAMVNQVGGNDDLVFDGRSLVVNPRGEVIKQCAPFESDLQIVETDNENVVSLSTTEPMRELWQGLVLGVKDYFSKTGNKSALIGISGGIDSALTATIAVASLGKENVHGVMLPSRYSSPGSIEDSLILAQNLDIAEPKNIEIEEAHKSFQQTLGNVCSGMADENVQARIRGLILMAISNSTGSLVLATGNKSEMAMGYCTLYGDMCGALAVLGDVYKTQIYDLARWINTNYSECGFESQPIPDASIEKVPSAELKPNQTDQDTLPPYEVLDEIVRRFVDMEQSPQRIIRESGFEAEQVEQVTRTIDRSEYKRMQAAIVLKVNPRTFGPGRPMPLAMHVNLKDC